MANRFRTLALSIQKQFNDYDGTMKRLGDETTLREKPPIFIVGSPRTGSTLLYQVLLSQFRLSYISNIMALMPAHMLKMARLYPKVATGFVGAYKENNYGYVPGLTSPNEAGKILKKWFEDLAQDEQHRQDIRQTVSTVTKLTDAVFLMKNQRRLTINLPLLQSTFPEARYIITHRDPRYVAQSMLLARREVMGDDTLWWNVQPDGYEATLDKSPLYQVLWQVMTLQEMSHIALQTHDNERMMVIDYEVLCTQPEAVLQQLQEKFSLEWHQQREQLPELRASRRVKLTDGEWEELNHHYQDLAPQFPHVANISSNDSSVSG
jgi:hypothetical protein